MEKSEFIRLLPLNKEHGIKARQLWRIHGQSQSFANFARDLRLLAADARKDGTKVIGDKHGYYLGQYDEDWEHYKNIQLCSIKSNLQNLASCENLDVRDFIIRLFPKKQTDAFQVTMEF